MRVADRRIGLFWDFENFELRCRSAARRLDVDRVMEFVKPRGRIVVNRAYADWPKHQTHMTSLARLGVETIQVTAVAADKNAADIKLVVDVMQQILPEPGFDELVIVTSDADFTPLIAVSLQKGVDAVTAIGTVTASSSMWRESVSEFIEYLDLPPSERFRSAATDPPKRTVGDKARKLKDSKVGRAVVNKVSPTPPRAVPQEAIPEDVRDLVLRAIADTPKKADGGFIQIGPLKTRVNAMRPSFDTKDYGCRTFKSFLDRLGDVIELTQQGVHYWVRIAVEPGAPAAGAAGTEPTGVKTPTTAGTKAEPPDPYAAALLAPGGRPPAPHQFAPLLDVLATREPGTPASAELLEASLQPVAAIGGLPAKGLKNFLINAHVVHLTDDGLCQRTADRRVLAACMVDAVLKTLAKHVHGRFDPARVAEVFGGSAAPVEVQDLLSQLEQAGTSTVPADGALHRLSLGGVPGGPEHRARIIAADTKLLNRADLSIEAIRRLTDALDPLPGPDEFLTYLQTTLLADWALPPEELGTLRGLIVRSGIVTFTSDGGQLAPDVETPEDAWRRIGALLQRTSTAKALDPRPHPNVLAGVALPARFPDERRAIAEGAAAELATTAAPLDPSEERLGRLEVQDREFVGASGLIAKTLWAKRVRIDPAQVGVMFATLADAATQPWSSKEEFQDHLAARFAEASLTSDGPTVKRAFSILVKAGAVDTGPPFAIRPIDATTAWDRLVPRIITLVRSVCGFVPWPEDLLVVLGGDQPSDELRSAVQRWIGVAEAVWLSDDVSDETGPEGTDRQPHADPGIDLGSNRTGAADVGLDEDLRP